jgi:hypothetical protein
MTLQLDSRAKKTDGPLQIRGEKLLGSAERFNGSPETALWGWAKVGTRPRQVLVKQVGLYWLMINESFTKIQTAAAAGSAHGR